MKNEHYCPEWDYMLIDSTCPEYEVCTCYPKNRKYSASYVSSTDFLTWHVTVEATSLKEASDIVSKKGRVLSINRE